MEELAIKIASALNLAQVPNLYDWLGVLGIFIFVFVAVLNFMPKDSKHEKTQLAEDEKAKATDDSQDQTVIIPDDRTAKPLEAIIPKVSWSERLKKGLSRTQMEVWGKIGNILNSSNISDEQFEQIEEILYTSDLSPATVADLLDHLKQRAKKEGESTHDFINFIKSYLLDKMQDIQSKVNKELYHFVPNQNQTKVIMIVGVNGAGKTTTIGKLATKLKAQGASVVVGACDTFRAAAVEQLAVWCERAQVEMIRAQDGADPSGVAFETVQKAVALKADYCLIDTAGRLHTASNLMDELAKTKKVMSKVLVDAPHETLLVIDAITGQNALRQAEEFNKALNLSGLIFTKCDGSAKAGSAVSIVQSLKVPITYIGVGEEVEDLNIFDLDDYLNALLGIQA